MQEKYIPWLQKSIPGMRPSTHIDFSTDDADGEPTHSLHD